jgi:hypothetical protein
VICIGLLGVLAVIPYGAYQTAKARNAENTSWLLANAEKDIVVAEMAKPTNWITVGSTLQSLGASPVNVFENNASNSDKRFNCSYFLMIDPFSSNPIANDHIFQIGTNFIPPQPQLFKERMMGQDDLVYTTHSDKRTDFSGQNNKILSSGQYTWLFMFRPKFDDDPLSPSPVSGVSQVNWAINDDVFATTDIDILGCYNRIPDEARTVYAQYVSYDNPFDDYNPLLNGAAITFRSSSAEELDVSKTKYIFISWPRHRGNPTLHHVEGCWCKIINATEIEEQNPPVISRSYKRTIYVTGVPPFVPHYGSGLGGITVPPYPEGLPNYMEGGGNYIVIRGLIIPGVMYHKRIPNVTIK